MAYWYPTQARVEELTSELAHLEQVTKPKNSSDRDFFSCLAPLITLALGVCGFPKRQLRRWIWLAAQLRINGGLNNEIATTAREALAFLAMRVARGTLEEADCQDLNWVLDSAIQKLFGLIDPNECHSYISHEEIQHLEKELRSTGEGSKPDFASIRKRLKEQPDLLWVLTTYENPISIETRIEALAVAAGRNDRQGLVANNALRYLGKRTDTGKHSCNVFDLINDVYIIKAAFAEVDPQIRYLPLLEKLLAVWPFVADLPLVGSGLLPLDRYSQYISSAALTSLFEERNHTLLIARESAAFCIISALMAAVEVKRRATKAADLDVVNWSIGQPIVIGDGTSSFKACYGGTVDIGGTQKHRISVKDAGRINLDSSMLPYMARAPAAHNSLSAGQDILRWQKDRRIDPLVYLTGSSRRRITQQECILLVGPRYKLDDYLSYIKPLSSTIGGLFGAQYVNAQHHFENVGEFVTDTPSLYFCSGADTAFDLIRDPPEHVAKWLVIVDGARNGNALLSSLASAGTIDKATLCIFAELHECEVTAELLKRNTSVWYLQDQDVEVRPLIPVSSDIRDDILVRCISRQQTHWTAKQSIHDASNDFLEQVSQCLKERTRTGNGETPENNPVDYLLSDFLQKAISYPLKNPDTNAKLCTLGRKIAAHASTLRQYDDRAARIFDLFKVFNNNSVPSFDKEADLIELAKGIGDGEKIAFVCRSTAAADHTRNSDFIKSHFRNSQCLTLAQLRTLAPFDRVIVPGWLDRMAMREICFSGYGNELHFLLLPFEQNWFESTVKFMQRWARRFEFESNKYVERIKKRMGASNPTLTNAEPTITASDSSSLLPSIDFSGNVNSVLHEPLRSEPRLTETETVDEQLPEDELSEIELLETRAIAAIRNATTDKLHEALTAKAQLVLFEEPDLYCFFPPAGRVIVLSDGEQPLDGSMLVKGQAERLLFRNVASLAPGMILALPIDTDRDLIDARADQFLQNAVAVRNCAALWKAALKRRFANDPDGHIKCSVKLAEAGQKRDPYTVKLWMTQTKTVAPLNYREVIPLIARITDDSELKAHCTQTLHAVELIYHARAEAADAIVKELFAGTINLDSEEIRFELNGSEIRYALHRVRRIGDIQEVPIEMIGEVGNMTSLLRSSAERDVA